ncbi:hypothetical protein EWM64_g9570, partial [Hericium alpestre]
ADSLSAEKIEAIGIEYSYLLTSQLDSQRSYYEEQIGGLRGEVAELKRMVETLGGEVTRGRKEAEEERQRLKKEEEERLAEVQRDKVKAERRAQKMAEVARNFETELRGEKAVSEGLMRNLEVMKAKVNDAETVKASTVAKVKDLEDQLRDVMFFLEARTKIEQGEGPEGEAAGGSVELPPERTPTTKKKKGRK